jgi:hypothetical protein
MATETEKQPSAARTLIRSLFAGRTDLDAADALESARRHQKKIDALDHEHDVVLTDRAEQLNEQRRAALLDAEPEDVDAIEGQQREVDRDRDRLKLARLELLKRRDLALAAANEERLDRIAAAITAANAETVSIDAEIKRLLIELSVLAFKFHVQRESALALEEYLSVASPDRMNGIVFPPFDWKSLRHHQGPGASLEHVESYNGRSVIPPIDVDALGAQRRAIVEPLLRPVSLEDDAAAES